MGFKTKHKHLIFSDLEKVSRDQKHKSLETLMNLENTIAREKIEAILIRDVSAQGTTPSRREKSNIN